MNGMIVTVERNETTDPRAPRIPSFLSQNPASDRAPKSHSGNAEYKWILSSRRPDTSERTVGEEGDQAFCLIIKPLLIAEEEVDDHHRRAY